MSLYDREYMRQNRNPRQFGGGQAVLALIVINVVCFLLARPGTSLYEHLALTIDGKPGIGAILQVVTAGFLHASFGHLFFNMWGLYIFGKLVAPHVSGIKFILLYLIGAVTGNLLFLLCNLGGQIGIVGASGAVFAVMAAAATLEPDRKFVMIFMPFFPLKTTTLVICYTIMELLFVRSSDGVAHLAHLGGFLGGYLTMRVYFGRNLPWDPLRKLFASRPRVVPPPSASGNTARVTQAEMDALLDKLSTQGINSLSEYELERLRKARRQMRGEE